MSQGKLVALPSTTFRALFDGKGFIEIQKHVSENVVALPSTSIRALPNGIGLDTIGSAVC